MEILWKWRENFAGKTQRHGNEFISVLKFCGNEGNFRGKKQRHGNLFIYVWKLCGNEGKSCTLTFLLLYVDSLIGNGT